MGQSPSYLWLVRRSSAQKTLWMSFYRPGAASLPLGRTQNAMLYRRDKGGQVLGYFISRMKSRGRGYLHRLTNDEPKRRSAVTEFVFCASLKIAETEHRFCFRKPASSSAWPCRPAEEKLCIPAEERRDRRVPRSLAPAASHRQELIDSSRAFFVERLAVANSFYVLDCR
jgi:hypothetical protein